MKNLKKKLVLGMAALLCASLSFTSGASAATSGGGSIKIGTIEYPTYATLSMGSSSATASTSCSTTAGVYAYVSYTYYYQNYLTETVTANQSNGSTSVSATANAKWVSVISRYASGAHSVSLGSGYWQYNTST